MKHTNIYDYVYLEDGDKLYSSIDQRNMAIAENSLSGLTQFIGNGVLSGFDISAMSDQYYIKNFNPDELDSIKKSKSDLINAWESSPDSFLGQQFYRAGLIPEVSVYCASTININKLTVGIIDGVVLLNTIRLSTDIDSLNKNYILVLLKNQTNPVENGVYELTSTDGLNISWSRITTNSDEIIFFSNLPYKNVFVSYGIININKLFSVTNYSLNYILDTTPILFFDPWAQIVRIQPGVGMLGYFKAQTNYPFYFRLVNNILYYAWAESSAYLSKNNMAVVTIPTNPQYDYDNYNLAAFLGQIEMTDISFGGINTSVVYNIDYTDRRNVLKDLNGAFLKAFKSKFLPHKHKGGIGNPSKINLSSELILDCIAPLGSTILQIDFGSNSKLVNNYGIPEVSLNNKILPNTSYHLGGYESGTYDGKLYLANSVSSNSIIKLILTSATQIKLFIEDGSSITDNIIYLTDGTTNTVNDGSGGLTTTQNIYTWDDSIFPFSKIYIKNNIYDNESGAYVINKNGSLILNSNIKNAISSGYVNSDLKVVLTKVGVQVKGILDGSRVINIYGESLTTGILNPKRIVGLDHVGELKIKESTQLLPYLRLFSQGDKTTFYPECVNSNLQFNTKIKCLSKSININPNYLVSTTHSIVSTNNVSLSGSSKYLVTDFVENSGWNSDFGEVVQTIDNLLNAEPNSNYFNTLYVRTKEGKVYYSNNKGLGWQKLKSIPSVIVNNNTVTPIVTAFWVSTERITDNSKSVATYKWKTFLYAGTDHGLYYAVINDGQSNEDWGWAESNFYSGTYPNLNLITDLSVSSLCEIMTMNRTTSKGILIEFYDRTLYVGTNHGLYAIGKINSIVSGDVNDSNKVINSSSNDDIVKNITWLRTADNNNNLSFSTNKKLYVSHDSEFVTTVGNIGDNPSVNTEWMHPLTRHNKSESNTVVAATTNNINLSGYSASPVVDGVTINNNDVIIVKNQTITINNGVYYYNSTSGGFSRFLSPPYATIDSTIWVKVSGGLINASSAWKLNGAGVWGTDNLSWKDLWINYFNTTNNINYIYEHPSQSIIFVGDNLSLYGFIDKKQNNIFIDRQLLGGVVWNVLNQENPTSMIVISNPDIENMTWIVGTNRGIWKSDNNGNSWNRITNIISSSNQYKLYDSITKQEINNYTFNVDTQEFIFNTSVNISQNFIYEKDFTTYYTSPWLDSGADILVYINDSPSNISFVVEPSNGKIIFNNSLDKNDIVTISIIRDGAYISNAGTIPHMELNNKLVTDNLPIAVLNSTFPATSSILPIADQTLIPVNTEYIELRTTVLGIVVRERINIKVFTHPNYNIKIIKPRSITAYQFPSGTNVYIVSEKNILGIEDLLSISYSNQTYNFNSITNDNLIKLSIFVKNSFNKLFNNLGGNKTSNSLTRQGPVNAIYTDFISNQDPKATSSTVYAGTVPDNINNNPTAPSVVYCFYPNTAVAPFTANNLRIGTDKGIWIYTNNSWGKETTLNNATRINFIKLINGVLCAGTEIGLFQLGIDGKWFNNPTYNQPVYSALDFTWANKPAQAYGKNDGIAFVTTDANNNLNSDHLDSLDGKNIYGFYKDKFFRTVGDGDNATQSEVDGLYCATEVGIYGLTNGSIQSRNQKYAAFLTGREMLGNCQLLNIIGLPDNGNLTVPIKYYNIFRIPPIDNPKSPPVPIILLTSNGVYKVRNWRFCDPDTTNASLDFHVENYALNGLITTNSTCPSSYLENQSQGISCYCHTYLQKNTQISPNKKINVLFIGTSKGVYRSFDEGISWEKCERIDNQDLVINDLMSVRGSGGDYTKKGCVIAATNNGLWFTDDDGDNWYKTNADSNKDVYFNSSISDDVYFNGGSLSQTFTTPIDTNVNTLNKLSLYLKVKENNSLLSQDNTINVQLWSVGNDGKPNNKIYPTATQYNLLKYYNGFETLNFNSSIDARRVCDFYVNDINTYYSSNSSMTFTYKLINSVPVDKATFSVYYTQKLTFSLSASVDDSTYVNIIPVVDFGLQNNNGLGQWANIVVDNINNSTSYKYYRLSVKDDNQIPTIISNKEIRVGDYRIYNNNIQYEIEPLLTVAEITHPGFKTFLVNASVASNTQYAIVSNETIISGIPLVAWVKKEI